MLTQKGIAGTDLRQNVLDGQRAIPLTTPVSSSASASPSRHDVLNHYEDSLSPAIACSIEEGFVYFCQKLNLPTAREVCMQTGPNTASTTSLGLSWAGSTCKGRSFRLQRAVLQTVCGRCTDNDMAIQLQYKCNSLCTKTLSLPCFSILPCSPSRYKLCLCVCHA